MVEDEEIHSIHQDEETLLTPGDGANSDDSTRVHDEKADFRPDAKTQPVVQEGTDVIPEA